MIHKLWKSQTFCVEYFKGFVCIVRCEKQCAEGLWRGKGLLLSMFSGPGMNFGKNRWIEE